MYRRETESAGGVVTNRRGEVLVVNQRGNSWSLPKGHVEKGEEPIAAARREIFEESGIQDLFLIKPLPSYKRFRIGRDTEREDLSELKTIHMFLFRTGQDTLEPSCPDSKGARWVPPENVAELLTHPKDKEFFCGILLELRNLRPNG